MPKKEIIGTLKKQLKIDIFLMLNRLQLEIFIAKEYGRLILRQPKKYIKYAVRDYFLWMTRIAPALRPAYLICRIIDDIADGERNIPPNFESFIALVDTAQEQILSGAVVKKSMIMFLLQYAILLTSRRERIQGETQKAYADTFNAMIVEYKRRTNKQLLSQKELISVHTSSSYFPHNIGLICLGSNNRAADTPELAELIGRIDALRDIEKDLQLGIVNIPNTIMNVSNCSYSSIVENPQRVYTYPAIRKWAQRELDEGEKLINILIQYKVDWTANFIIKSRIKKRIPFVREKFPRLLYRYCLFSKK